MANDNRIKGDVFVQGGLINDVDVTITAASYVMFDYDGNLDSEACMARLVLTDNEGSEHVNHWSMGGKEGDYVPTKDGKGIRSLNGKTALNKGSNYHLLVESLNACGMPEGFIADEITNLVGAKVHVLRKPAPQRNIEGQKKREDGRVPEVLVVSEVYKWPKGAKGAKTTKASSAKASAKDTEEEGGDDFDTLLTKYVVAQLKQEGEPMDLDDLAMNVYVATSGNMEKSERGQVTMKLNDPDYVASLEGVKVEDGKAALDD